MDRLTVKSETVEGYVLKELCQFNREGSVDDEEGCAEYCEECNSECDKCVIQNAFNKLADYENTGLTPEQIIEMNKLYAEKCREVETLRTDGYFSGMELAVIEIALEELKKYKDAEEQGLLLRLPCKVGDVVYIIPTYENCFKDIEKMICYGFAIGEPCNVVNCSKKGLSGLYQPSFDMFGDTIFLTRETAEAKLEELRGAK